MPQSSFLSTAFLQPQNYKLLFQWTLLFQWYTSPCISHKKPAFHIKSLSILLDPYCEIETYAMDKKTGICTVEGTALSINSIPTTGFLSYPRRSGYETVTHTFPVTMKISLLSVLEKNSSDWLQPPCLNTYPHNENTSCNKVNYYYSTAAMYLSYLKSYP